MKPTLARKRVLAYGRAIMWNGESIGLAIRDVEAGEWEIAPAHGVLAPMFDQRFRTADELLDAVAATLRRADLG